MKARIEQERQEKAGRLLQYTLNKIVDSKYVQAWERWQEVHKAMLRAGRIMHRVMCRFTNAQLVGGWERWMEVWEAQRHAAAVMQRCLGRIARWPVIRPVLRAMYNLFAARLYRWNLWKRHW